jgi:hypothetical protein
MSHDHLRLNCAVAVGSAILKERVEAVEIEIMNHQA